MPKRILIIGDDAPTMALISTILTSAHYSVTTQTHSTYDPKHAAAAQAILIVIDRSTGDSITVWQTVQRLRLDRILTHLPLIICTDIEPTALETNFYQKRRIIFVQKPFVDDELLAAVNLTIEESWARLSLPNHTNGLH